LSPEIVLIAGADAVQVAEGIILVQNGITPGSRRGQRAGHVCVGVLQEPGRPCHLRLDMRMVGPGYSTGPYLAALGRVLEQIIKRSAVSEGEGNEAQREG
jgi:hypothetical protein